MRAAAPRRALTLLSLLCLAPAAAGAQPAGSAPERPGGDDGSPLVRPVLDVPRAAGGIAIDGALDDPGWRAVARATGFSENFPDERARPPVASQAWVTYDDEHLYVALIAEDDPATIRASLRERDEIWQDDYFGILLDTYGDASWAYFLFANPLGIQGDTRFSSTSGEDESFDIVFESAGRITETGYQIELAIPFRSLRFPDRPVQEWRATFWRTRPRGSRAQYTWAAMDRDEPCFLCQFGTLAGIEGVKAGGALELLPAIVGSGTQSLVDPDDPRPGFASTEVTGDPSLGARYSFPVGVTADLALNPDFSQVESDVAQIDVNSTFALFFPERRPFFQEGADIFRSPIDAVYTRSINDPQAAGKLIGQLGRTSFGYIGARDETSPVLIPLEERSFVASAGRSVSNILRGRRTFGDDSYVGLLATDRRFEAGGGSNTVFGADGQFRLLGNYRLEWQVLGSRTGEPDAAGPTAELEGETFGRGAHTTAFDGEDFWGYAQYTSLERDARTWNFDLDYWAYSPAFRADNGFETRNDLRRVSLWQGLSFWPEWALVDALRPGMYVQRTWNFAGERKSEVAEASLNLELKGQTFVNVWYNVGAERFAGTDFGGIRRFGLFVNSNFSEPVRLGLSFSRGERIRRDRADPRLGTGTDLGVFATFKPLRRLVIQPELDYSELHDATGERFFRGYILRTRSSLQLTRELAVRLVVQYNDFSRRFDVEPLLTYRANPFTVFFLGSNLRYREFDEPARGLAATERQFFAKLQYLLRI